MQVLPGKVLVEIAPKPEKIGMLYTPDTARGLDGQVLSGTVIATGKQIEDYRSSAIPESEILMTIKEGMTVWFPKHQAFEIEYNGKKLYSMPEHIILAYIQA